MTCLTNQIHFIFVISKKKLRYVDWNRNRNIFPTDIELLGAKTKQKNKKWRISFIFRSSVYVLVLYNSIRGKKKKIFFSRWCCKQRPIFFRVPFWYFILFFANDSPPKYIARRESALNCLFSLYPSAVPLIYYRFSFASSSVFEFLLF